MKLLKITKFAFVFFFLCFFLHSIFIVADGLGKNNKSADVAVILGTKVNEDGTLSPRLIKRLECGFDLFKNKRVKMVVVSGGLGIEGYYEGTMMKEFLLKKGLPDTCIRVDNKGDNTRATVRNTVLLMHELNFSSAIVVSQYFHVSRAKMLFRKQGIGNVSSLSPKYFEIRDFHSIIREFFAFYTQVF